MSDLYNDNTVKILRKWLDRLKSQRMMSLTLFEKLKSIVDSGNALSEQCFREAVNSYKDELHETD